MADRREKRLAMIGNVGGRTTVPTMVAMPALAAQTCQSRPDLRNYSPAAL